MADGLRTTDLPLGSALDEIVGHQTVGGELKTRRVPINEVAAQIAGVIASGPNDLAPVRFATTANGTLATAFDDGSPMDGGTLATNDRLLIKDQAAQAANGIYVVQASGAPVRASDADLADRLGYAAVYVREGTVNRGKTFKAQQGPAEITIETTAITFVETGNEDAVSARLTDVETDVATLTTHVDDVEADRIAADAAEATARADADTAEATARVAADALKAPLASPTLTGVPAAPTAAPGTNTTQLATTAFSAAAVAVETTSRIADVDAEETARIAADALKAPLASPTFTGNPLAPTPTQGDNDTSIATTAFTTTAVAAEATLRTAADSALDTRADALEALSSTTDTPTGYAWSLANEEGTYSVGLTDDGILDMVEVNPTKFKGIDSWKLRELVIPAPTFTAEYLLIVSYGQSLSLGHGTGAPINTAAEQWGSLKFISGPRAWNGGAGAADYASLVPYAEVQETTFGETPLFGCLEAFGDRVNRESGGTLAEFGINLIGEACGENSQAVNALKTGAYFNRITDAVGYGQAIAEGESKTFRVGGVCWTQGEADDLAGTSNANYITRFGEFRTNLLAGVAGIIPAQTEVPIVMYQTASHQMSSLTAPLTALAQLTICRAGAANKVFMACPAYIFDYVDGYHLKPESSHMMGCYYALVLKRVLVDGLDWEHLDIVSVTRHDGDGVTGNILMVKFRVPHGQLRFTDELVTLETNNGFTVVAAATETATAISSTSIVGRDTVKIVCATAPPSNARLRYAWLGSSSSGRYTGPRGNLCDSMGDVVQIDSVDVGLRRLDNYCPMFEQVVA